jgi:hypothetical protein
VRSSGETFCRATFELFIITKIIEGLLKETSKIEILSVSNKDIIA